MKSTLITLVTALISLSACGKSAMTHLPDDPGFDENSIDAKDIGRADFAPPASGEVPSLSHADRQRVLAKYAYLDPKHLVPTKLLANAVIYYHINIATFPNHNYISVINFSARSSQARFFLVNLKTGAVWAIHVAHGRGSDPDGNGYANSFGNVNGSGKSSLGFYRVSEAYNGSHGLSARFDGLSKTNSHVRERVIVLHGADYVREDAVIQGRSLGCTAVAMALHSDVVNRLSGGSLLYASTLE